MQLQNISQMQTTHQEKRSPEKSIDEPQKSGTKLYGLMRWKMNLYQSDGKEGICSWSKKY